VESSSAGVVVGSTTLPLLSEAQALGLHLSLPALSQIFSFDDRVLPNTRYGMVLLVTPEGLKLKDLKTPREAPIWVDFTSSKLRLRAKQAGAAKQSLAKAVGIKPGWRPTIIDATAGLGRDGFVLASLGCHVTMLERHPVVAELLKDGIKRAALHSETTKIVQTAIKFIPGQAANIIDALAEDQCADVIYLDPMFPHRDKSALIKKEMRLFQTMVGIDEDVSILFEAALKSAKKRVVVKRPNSGRGLQGMDPHLVITGKSTRYDIYFTHR